VPRNFRTAITSLSAAALPTDMKYAWEWKMSGMKNKLPNKINDSTDEMLHGFV
jgi:hypothetical protein